MRVNATAILICAGVAVLSAQTVINGSRTVTGTWDASSAAATKPAKVGNSVPAQCSAGELFFNTSSPAGQNIFLCQPANVWTQLNGVNANAAMVNQANTFSAGTTQSFLGRMDASGASATLPVQTAGALPGTCSQGQLFLNTATSDASRMLFICMAPNTWTQSGYQQGTTVSMPSSCAIGQMYFATDTTAGQNLYLCTGTNTWTRAAGSGGGTATSYVNVFDGSGATLGDGSHLTWSCGTGQQAQCTATWTVPAGVNWVRVRAVGGGGGGGGPYSSFGFGGGGGGGSAEAICAATPGAVVTIAVGAGGTGSTTYTQSYAGGNSSFGSCLTVTGGSGGSYSDYSQGGWMGWGGGILSSNANVQHMGWWSQNFAIATPLPISTSSPSVSCTNNAAQGSTPIRPDGGGCGGGAQPTTNSPGLAGGNAIWGGGGGGGAALGTSTSFGIGGVSVMAGAGGNGGASGIHCTAGTAPGGGGGAASFGLDSAGCSGARGEVRVYYTR
jgi:hypothetical protein